MLSDESFREFTRRESSDIDSAFDFQHFKPRLVLHTHYLHHQYTLCQVRCQGASEIYFNANEQTIATSSKQERLSKLDYSSSLFTSRLLDSINLVKSREARNVCINAPPIPRPHGSHPAPTREKYWAFLLLNKKSKGPICKESIRYKVYESS
jgi:hypothetical protein